ncbi:CYTH domain-containing protein [Nocardia veterana]|uniref:CYTH domain-containing protein n=1 Tax=Nocardia veterana TaxID=132249 RepID=A0A7X6RKH6_9NOCA|nr:CYTH domain-containing protein [Nocardia veterana]
MLYHDTYFDTPSGDPARSGREFRLRTVADSSGGQRHVLTFKDPVVDEASGSKPEFETLVADRNSMGDIIARLGYETALSFTKRCENFEFTASGRRMVATIARVSEIDGTFLELGNPSRRLGPNPRLHRPEDGTRRTRCHPRRVHY